jgi:peptidoglycan/xylan/chitin deacetylase (PgdA/CDA1 family)
MLYARFESDTGRVSVPFNLSEAYLNYVHERWHSTGQGRHLSDRQLALFYRMKRFIPRNVQLRARRVLIRRQKDPEFPRWPLDESVSRLFRLYAKCLLLAAGQTELPFRWFWPKPYRAALVLTHDVESAEGLRLAVELADLEEERGLRSSFNVVADWYPIDWGIVRELQARGFEFGVHGVHHDRSMFSSRAAFESQQPAVREMAAKLGAVGFRSPATHRVIDWLADLPLAYDCSVPHSDPFEPQPGGCCSLWPFFLGDVVELPYTLPQDHTVFTLLGHRSIDVWRTQLERIEGLNGLAQVLSHPDPGYLGDLSKRALYVEFLDLVRERSELWTPLPREAADWWRVRDDASGSDDRIAPGTVRLDGDHVRVEPAL